MKTSFVRTPLALGALMTLTSIATAQESGVRNAFQRWSDAPATSLFNIDEQEVANAPATLIFEQQLASCAPCTTCSYDGTSEWPGDDGSSDSCDNGGCSDSGCDEGCTCDSCHGDCYGDGCSCGAGCCNDCECGTGGECCGACGQDCSGCDCGDCSSDGTSGGMFYAEIQNIFMRTHVSSDVIGKLREKYEWSPRVVMGYEMPGGLGGRVRWWSYDRTSTTVDSTNALRVDLDVFDAEGTARFSSRRADLVIAGGFRYADFSIAEGDDPDIRADLPGITFAADGRMAICCLGNSQWSGVCGARWSILGGDWEGEDNGMVEAVFDDNVTVQEIYGGFEYLCHYGNCDLFARLVFEMQNWHSDALGENSETDSIGFVGPAIHGGVSF